MSWFQELLSQMSSVAIITGILAWSATSIVKHISKIGIEKFKIEFKNDYEKQIEKYKLELNQQHLHYPRFHILPKRKLNY